MRLIDLESRFEDGTNFVGFINAICETLNVDYASYAALGLQGNAVQGFANYPDPWKEHYTKSNFATYDPILHVAARSITPIDWSLLKTNPNFDAVFKEAAGYGITPQGVTVPVRGPNGDIGLFSVTSSCSASEWLDLRDNIAFDLQSIAVHFHDAFMKTQMSEAVYMASVLSQRETEILQWIAAGKSQQDVSTILGISHRTVEVHLRSTRTKLGALTTPQAIGRAIKQRLIEPS
jgi:DNA-binding CsgD family transcriptional regulator